MVQSVELLLDEESEASVRGRWRALAAAGLPSQARHAGASNAPHVTLAVATSLPGEVEAALPALVGGLPLPVRIGSPILFGRRRHVLALLVVPSAELLALQAAVAEALDGCAGTSELLQPGRWTPHVTLARNLRTDHVGEALEALRTPGEPLEGDGQVVAARRWDGDRRVAWPLSPPGSPGAPGWSAPPTGPPA